MARSVLDIQRQLKLRGFNPGPLDGVMGPKTERAIVQFKRSRGLRERPYIGPITERLLFEPQTRNVPNADGLMPPWLVIAESLKGVREIRGRKHNPAIIRMWESIKAPFRDDETPWCAGFVGHCLEEAGFRSTRSAAARSYERWQYGARLAKPVYGCIVVFWRGKPNGWSGHVGFVVGQDQSGRLLVLGGNQGNAVNVKPFDQKRVVGYFWPKGYPLSGRQLKTVESHARSSTNEA